MVAGDDSHKFVLQMTKPTAGRWSANEGGGSMHVHIQNEVKILNDWVDKATNYSYT